MIHWSNPPRWSEVIHKEKIDVRSYPVEQVQQFNKQLRSSPEGAIDRLRTSYRKRRRQGINPELFALCSAVKHLFYDDPEAMDDHDAALNTVDVWARLLKGGLIGVYGEMISSNEFLLEYPSWITEVLAGLGGIVRAFGPKHCVRLKSCGVEVLEMIDSLLSSVRTVCDAFMKDDKDHNNVGRSLLLGKGREEKHLPGCGERLRATIVTVLEHCLPLCEQSDREPAVSQTELPFVVLLCWYATKENHPDVSRHLKCVSAYLRLAKISLYGNPYIAGETRYTGFGSSDLHDYWRSIASRIIQAIQNQYVVDRPLKAILHDLGPFLSDRPITSPLSVSHNTMYHICNALMRQLAIGKPEHHWNIFSDTLVLLESTRTSFGTLAASNSQFVEEEGAIVRIVAHALLVCVENDCDRHELVMNVLGIYRCVAAYRTKNLVFLNQRKAVQKEWYPTLKSLYDTRDEGLVLPPEFGTLVKEWKAFGETFGLDEDEEKDRLFPDLEKRCAWKECKWHTQTHVETREMLCPGCKQKRYCDLLCRRRDWHAGGHKDNCQKAKAQVRMPGQKRTVSLLR